MKLCSHSKLNGIRHRGYVNEYRQCVLCKKEIYTLTEKELKRRKHNRLLIDMIIDDIKKIDNEISDYSNHMDDDSFDNSDEVEALYTKLKDLCADLSYIDK